ncbi:MAG TPA: DUF6036 family nucleotidyltransferase [Candidatus Acidoferrum sp.]|nr:DUF6036 family nucleotidyltransferase [Candidatus Acidoferrum sp.]
MFDRLERDEVRYVVIGGVAVVLHGHVRPIVDLDIVVDPAPREADRALSTLARCGFVPSIPLPLAMVSVLRMFDRLQREVDVNVRYHIPFDELWAGAQRVRTGDSAVRVASLDDLLRAKRITARPHDLQDVEGLLRVLGGQPGA